MAPAPPDPGAPQAVFDRRAVRLHRDRAALKLADHDFLFSEVADRLTDRLNDVKRSFPVALDLGCHGGEVAQNLARRGGVETLVHCDLSPAMTAEAADTARCQRHPFHTIHLSADEEALPLRAESLDLVLSNLSLHWVNDLPGALVQVRQALKPDRLFLAAMLGEGTLQELRAALMAAENEIEGGVSPRVSPYATVQDLGALLQRAGFTLPVVDTETITVSYPHMFKLMHDLRGMGETGAVCDRRKTFTRRAVIVRAAEIYFDRFAGQDDCGDGRIPATFDIIYLTAWSPHPDQPQALKPGTGQTSLEQVFAPDIIASAQGENDKQS